MALWLLLAAALFAAAPIPRLPGSVVAPPMPVMLVTKASAARLTPMAPMPIGGLQAIQILSETLPKSPEPSRTLEDFWSGQRKPAIEAQDSLERIVHAAAASPAGRRVMTKVAELGAVPVVFTDLRNLAEYDYATGVMYMDHSAKSGDVRAAAATLVHELVHVLQHAEGLPAQAVELEYEAHAITLMVMRELGLKPDNPFSWRAEKKLGQGVDEYMDWMAEQLSNKHRLEGRDFDAVLDDIEEDIEKLERKAPRSKRAAADLQWAKRDADALRTDAGREAYFRFAKRVRALLRRLHTEIAASRPY